MIEPTAKECNPCHFNVDSKCYKPCNHIKSEFARLEKENEELKQALFTIFNKTNHCAYSEEDSSRMIDESCNLARQALQNAKS
jgi:hypothetical protein